MGVAISTKITGVYLLISGLLILISYGIERKKIWWFLVPALTWGASFYIYGLVVNKDIMLRSLLNQGSRGFFGSLNFLSVIPGLPFDGFPQEGYWIWGLASLALLAKTKKGKELLITAGCYLATLFLTGGANYGWYYLPLIPLLVMGSAMEIGSLIVKPEIINLVIFFLLPLSSSYYWGYLVRHINGGLGFYRLLIIWIFLASIRIAFRQKWKLLDSNLVTFLWTISFIGCLLLMHKWNQQGFLFIIENWDKLPKLFKI